MAGARLDPHFVGLYGGYGPALHIKDDHHPGDDIGLVRNAPPSSSTAAYHFGQAGPAAGDADPNEEDEEIRYWPLVPPATAFEDREAALNYIRDHGRAHGYGVAMRRSKGLRFWIQCDRGGRPRPKPSSDASKKKRNTTSRRIDCPFSIVGMQNPEGWTFSVENPNHNHLLSKDPKDHPSLRRLPSQVSDRIFEMTEAGLKPRKIISILNQEYPGILIVPTDLYNLRQKIRRSKMQPDDQQQLSAHSDESHSQQPLDPSLNHPLAHSIAHPLSHPITNPMAHSLNPAIAQPLNQQHFTSQMSPPLSQHMDQSLHPHLSSHAQLSAQMNAQLSHMNSRLHNQFR